MTWFIIIVFVIVYIIWKYNDDTKRVKSRNEALGGMKIMFPGFVDYFESNGFELVENSSAKLLYKLQLTNNPSFNNYLFLGIESKFTNIAYGYVLLGNGKKLDGLNVEFTKNYRIEEVEMIIRKIIGELRISGKLNYNGL